MSKLNSSYGFISLLYSIGDNPLGLWSKYSSSEGRVRRIEDETLNGDRVIEIRGPEANPSVTNISCPASPLDCLNIQLPVLVIIMKNLKARVQITFQLIDDENIRRKFILSNCEINGKVEPETARLNLKLEDDWNNLEIDLRSLCQSIYRTEYRALQRLIIYQNCRIRRIYLQDRHYDNHETPVELCQAFFDMYMLKWGINFVEKGCQTNLSCADLMNDETIMSTTIPRKQRDEKSLSNDKLSTSQGKRPARPKDHFSSDENSSHEKNSKIIRAATAMRKKVIEEGAKGAMSLGKIVSTPIAMEKSAKKKINNEGEIFRKWPYNYLQFQQVGRSVSSKLKQIDPANMRKNLKINEINMPIVGPTNINVVKGQVLTIPMEMPIPSDVEEAAAETAKNVKLTRSKVLTTDEAVGDYLELRHVINRKMLENYRSRGLTMTEVELSIYNSKNRRNSYGQGKLIQKHRTRIDKACSIISAEDRTKKREKSAIRA